MIVADAARITAAAWILIVVIVSARPMLLGDALTLSFDKNDLFINKFLDSLLGGGIIRIPYFGGMK